MKIAIVGSLYGAISENSLAGTEIWTYNFVQKLVERGHEVTLFARKESKTSAKLYPVCAEEDLINKATGQCTKRKVHMFDIKEIIDVMNRQDDFDVIHFSTSSYYLGLPFTNGLIKKPVVITAHTFGDFDYSDMSRIFEQHKNPYYIFPTEYFLKKWPKPSRYQVISHGIDLNHFEYKEIKKDNYYWIGSICPEKGLKDAIMMSKKAQVKLLFSGPISDEKYFKNEIEPELSNDIKYLGEADLKDKIKHYGDAKAVLFTSGIEETFGLVVTEAMACGTPVLAYDIGPMSEIIIPGYNGYLADRGDIDGLVKAIYNINEIKPVNCRKTIEEKFNDDGMINQYLKLYNSLQKNA